jgi:hypothetical protein
MFISENSRYHAADLLQTSEGNLRYALRKNLEYLGGEEDIPHEIIVGDTLHSLAARYYDGMGGAELWWAIADYQPEPIIDPTVQLTPGDILLIPAPYIVQDFIQGVDEEDSWEVS